MSIRSQALERRLARIQGLGALPRPWALSLALLLEGSLVGGLWVLSLANGPIAQARTRAARLESSHAEGRDLELEEERSAEPVTLPPPARALPTLELAPVTVPEFLAPLIEPEPVVELIETPPRDEAWLEPLRPKPPEDQVERPTEPSATPSAARAKVEPIEGFCPEPEYPARALRLGQEGSMKLRLLVAADGTVGDIVVLERNCSELLLRTARRTLLTWRFRNGPGPYDQVVRFELR